MKHSFLICVIGASFVATSYAWAAEMHPIPGTYVRQGDSGNLKIVGSNTSSRFEIESIGSNCHQCSVAGSLQGTIGDADDWASGENGSKCTVTFKVNSGAELIVGSSTPDACRGYCGARANFTGRYRMPSRNCTVDGMKSQRDAFLKLYQSKRYSEARKSLDKLISECEFFMHWYEVDKVRNDLALTLFHNGEPQQCLEILAKTAGGQYSEQELKRTLPPCDFDNYEPTAKAIRFNQAKCSKRTSE